MEIRETISVMQTRVLALGIFAGKYAPNNWLVVPKISR
jgi:hypothetical protein